MNMPLPVAIHLASTLAALVLGGALLGRRIKGDRAHRIAGWSWVVLMLVAAIATLWIPGFLQFSWIHVFTVITLVSVPRGVAQARRRDVTAHSQTMKGVFLYALVIAGLFALIPGRRLGNMVLALF
jgi:uncharacterized membrane protein